MRVDLAGPIDVRDFRAHANGLLAQQVEPADIEWEALASVDYGVRFRTAARTPVPPSALHSIVPRSFLRLTELVLLHRDPARFALMYRLLWRLVHEPGLASGDGDAEMALARSMAQGVRRDLLRTCRFVRLQALAPQDGVPLSLAWCEPQHRVTERVAEWLAKEHPTPPWLLASPDSCVLWTGRHLLCGPGVAPHARGGRQEPAWHVLAAQLACAVAPAVD